MASTRRKRSRSGLEAANAVVAIEHNHGIFGELCEGLGARIIEQHRGLNTRRRSLFGRADIEDVHRPSCRHHLLQGRTRELLDRRGLIGVVDEDATTLSFLAVSAMIFMTPLYWHSSP